MESVLQQFDVLDFDGYEATMFGPVSPLFENMEGIWTLTFCFDDVITWQAHSYEDEDAHGVFEMEGTLIQGTLVPC